MFLNVNNAACYHRSEIAGQGEGPVEMSTADAAAVREQMSGGTIVDHLDDHLARKLGERSLRRGVVDKKACAAAVIMAGGSGERFGNPGGKQLFRLMGRPILSWSIEAFDAAPDVAQIVVVCPDERVEEYRRVAVEPYGFTTPITFVSTNHAILYENLKPVFADVDQYLCLDPTDVEKKITDKTRAVMFVGYGGRVGQLDKVLEICKNHGLRLILDAAHMSGTRVNGVTPGTWEGVDVAVYSYQAVKNLPTGDSGMICFADGELDAECRKVSWMGINKDTYSHTSSEGTYKWNYGVDYVGYKYNGNAIMAAIALAQLPYLDEENVRRREIVKMYNERGAVLGGIRVSERIIPGALYQDHGARVDNIVIGEFDRAGANNLICPSNTTSKNAPGEVTNSFLVNIEKVDVFELARQYPEAFSKVYDKDTGQVAETVIIMDEEA